MILWFLLCRYFTSQTLTALLSHTFIFINQLVIFDSGGGAYLHHQVTSSRSKFCPVMTLISIKLTFAELPNIIIPLIPPALFLSNLYWRRVGLMSISDRYPEDSTIIPDSSFFWQQQESLLIIHFSVKRCQLEDPSLKKRIIITFQELHTHKKLLYGSTQSTPGLVRVLPL